MRSNITQLIIGTAVAFGMSLVAPTQVMGQEGLTNRFESPISETDFRISDRQQLRGYFLDGSRDRLR